MDGSLLGAAGKWGTCGWSVVQLDHDEELGPMHDMYGTLEAGLEVHRTVKRAEMTAFSYMGIIDDCGKEQMKCIGPKAKDAGLW